MQRSPLGEDSRVWALLGAAIWQSRVMAPLGILVDLGMCVLMCPSAEPAALGALWHGLCHPGVCQGKGCPLTLVPWAAAFPVPWHELLADAGISQAGSCGTRWHPAQSPPGASPAAFPGAGSGAGGIGINFPQKQDMVGEPVGLFFPGKKSWGWGWECAGGQLRLPKDLLL